MKPFVQSQMSDAQLETLAELDRRAQKIPDDLVLPPSIECITCHMLAHALHLFEYSLNLTLNHGTFRFGFEHSWFTDDRGCVYDPYPVGMLSGKGHSVLFVAHQVVRTGQLYETTEECKRRFIRLRDSGEDAYLFNPRRVKSPCKRTSAFRKAVRILVEVMR